MTFYFSYISNSGISNTNGFFGFQYLSLFLFHLNQNFIFLRKISIQNQRLKFQSWQNIIQFKNILSEFFYLHQNFKLSMHQLIKLHIVQKLSNLYTCLEQTVKTESTISTLFFNQGIFIAIQKPRHKTLNQSHTNYLSNSS